MIYALKIEFALLDRRKELVFSALTKCVGIRRSNIYTILSINTYKAKSLFTNINRL